jgi:ribosomal protein S18 acetylase RimI-like enzyme
MAYVVRRAGLEDAVAVRELLIEFNGEALVLDALVSRMQQATTPEVAFLAEQGGSPAGLLVLRIAPTLSEAHDWAEITELYVRPAFRRQRIGTGLVHAAVDHSRSRGCSELHLLVDPENRDAGTFYVGLGFSLDSCAMRCRL